MKDIGTQEGSLDLVLGTSWISRYEAGRLEAGSIILSDRIAGTGQELRFNGERIADAEVVVASAGDGNWICARIESLERQAAPAPEPERGATLTEILPCSILLGRAQATLDQLAGLGRESVIDLGVELKKPGQEANGTLLVAGREAARGIIVVIGESMGIRITEVLARLAGEAEFRTSGKVLTGAAAEKAKDYDFSRPDCFTKAQLEALSLLHLDFLRSFGILAGIPTQEAKLFVDQLNFTEFADSLEVGEFVLAAPCGAGRDRVPEAAAARPEELLRLGSAPGFPEEAIRDWVRHERAKPSSGAVLAAGKLARERGKEIFTALRDAWKNFGALSPVPSGSLEKPSGERPALAFSEYADEYEMVALAAIDLGAEGRLNIAYPLRAIEPVLKALAV